MGFDLVQIFSAFIVLFAIIDVAGAIPLFISIKEKQKIKPIASALVSLIIFLVFFYGGDAILNLFGVDIALFAIAGAIVIFVLAVEMILGIEIIKNDISGGDASIVPIAFPLIAGPGALTAMISLKAEYADLNILLGLALNIICVFLVLTLVEKINKVLGQSIVFILRKFFGVILLAISIKLFATNLMVEIAKLST